MTFDGGPLDLLLAALTALTIGALAIALWAVRRATRTDKRIQQLTGYIEDLETWAARMQDWAQHVTRRLDGPAPRDTTPITTTTPRRRTGSHRA